MTLDMVLPKVGQFVSSPVTMVTSEETQTPPRVTSECERSPIYLPVVNVLWPSNPSRLSGTKRH